MEKVQNLMIPGSKVKPILLDIYFNKEPSNQPVILFCHGFKGFKNWGHFDLIAEYFASKNFVFVKFNFSHNGTTPLQPQDFIDLEAFGNNNFQIELDDAGLVIDYICKNASTYPVNTNNIYMIGHSRGGGIAILKTNEDNRIKKLVTWASVKDIADFFGQQNIEQWKKDGKIVTYNSRTKQDMPLNYQLYENYIEHKERLNLSKAAENCSVPWLIVHGKSDTSVPIKAAQQLHQQNKNSKLLIIENGDHTFGGKHPWMENKLPDDAKKVVEKTLSFLNEKLDEFI